MKNKKMILLIIAIILVIVSAVSCQYVTTAFVISPEAPSNQSGQAPAEEAQNPSPSNQEEQPQTEPAKEAQKEENVVYISASKLNVRAEAAKDAKIVTSLIKGAAVTIKEEKTDENQVMWYNVSFDDSSADAKGWIAAEYTVEDRMELLDESLRSIDLSPQEKTFEYPNNPRVEVKGVYVTLYSASGARLDKLIEMSKRTEINTFVIDVKDDNGNMLFATEAADKFNPDANKKAPIKDIKAFMQKLKDNNIYAIARIVSFKDPSYAKKHPDKAIVYKDTNQPFTNSDGLIWVSAHDRDLWQYNLEVAKEAAAAGFNEIQFDYVRFPASNGGKLDKMLDYRNTTGESKPETIQNYLKEARKQLSPLGVYISADIYGLVGSVADDMALGQYWEAVSNVVDYVSPMMYPSHYANGTYGLSIPDAYPYETIYQCTKDSISRNKNIQTPATIRPWIQDFTAPWVKGHIKYGVNEVEAQIKALEDNGVKEYLLWNAGNTYSEGALLK
ncbi:MAG: hypothetical protein K0R84_475 [Clostridia bacterium]|jgi:hypothetical protein|nr:hypothetical protein [Clostridia bacterium]